MCGYVCWYVFVCVHVCGDLKRCNMSHILTYLAVLLRWAGESVEFKTQCIYAIYPKRIGS